MKAINSLVKLSLTILLLTLISVSRIYFPPFPSVHAQVSPNEDYKIITTSASLNTYSKAGGDQDSDSDHITSDKRDISVISEASYDHQKSDSDPWWAMSHSISHGFLKAGSANGIEEITGELCGYARSGSDGVYKPVGKSETTSSGEFSVYTNGRQANLKVSAVYNSGCSDTNEHCVGNHTFDGAFLTISGPNANNTFNFSECQTGCGTNEKSKEQTFLVSDNDQFNFLSGIGGTTLGNGVFNGCIEIKIKIEPVKCTLDIVQSDPLWYFCGATPINYKTSIKLEARGAKKGTFDWQIVEGKDKVTIAKKIRDRITLESIGRSRNKDDVVLVGLNYDDGFGVKQQCYYSLVVRAPTKLIMLDPAKEPNLPSNPWDKRFGLFGYQTEIYYVVIDQFGVSIPHVAVNEQFVGNWDYGENEGKYLWPEITDKGGNLTNSYGVIHDTISANGLLFRIWKANPLPVTPNDPLASQKVRQKVQRIYCGSLVEGRGCLIQENFFVNYRGYGRHENIKQGPFDQ